MEIRNRMWEKQRAPTVKYANLTDSRGTQSYGLEEVGKLYGPSMGGNIENLWNGADKSRKN
jgi:hypothetical protein